MIIFDSHTHIHFSDYNKDRNEVIERARKAGVKMITVGINPEDSKRAIEIAEKYPENIWATVGIHPHETEIATSPSILLQAPRNDDKIATLALLARNDKVVAIGECGLDYYRFKIYDSGFKERQKELFIKQIKLAIEINKPLMIHCRNAYQDLISILNSHISHLKSSESPGVIHFFSGNKKDAEQLLNMGFNFTFGGVITFSRDYDEVINFLPLDKILLETDAPYVAPEPYRGKRNESVYVVEVAKKIAEIKRVSFEDVVGQTTENVKEVFKIDF